MTSDLIIFTLQHGYKLHCSSLGSPYLSLKLYIKIMILIVE